MEALLKNKTLWQFTKTMISYLKDDQQKFVINGKKDEVVGLISTYISREICFHTSNIDCPHQGWKKLKTPFDKIDKSRVMQIEKELISMDPLYFERIEYYLSHVKELQLKLGECGKDFLKKYD